jgi:hypothetical protein
MSLVAIYLLGEKVCATGVLASVRKTPRLSCTRFSRRQYVFTVSRFPTRTHRVTSISAPLHASFACSRNVWTEYTDWKREPEDVLQEEGLIRQYEKRLLTPVGHNCNYKHTCSTKSTLHYVHTLYLHGSFSQ